MPWSPDDLPDSVSGKNWSDEQKEKFCRIANAMLHKGIAEGECIATATKRVEENKNSKDFPKFYYARHMRSGLAKGGGSDPEEVMKIDLPAIKKMVPTGPGKPVYIQHADVDLDTMKDEASGYITESFLESDGWWWFKVMIIDDEAHQFIKDGCSVSNAYFPIEKAQGGTMHNCDYDIEIMDGEITHLALVANPRYEEACIMSPEEFKIYREKQRATSELKNAKEQTTMFKIFKTAKREVTNASDITPESFVEIDGQKVSFKDLIQNTKEKMNKKDDGEEDEDGPETEKEEKEDEKKMSKEKKNKKEHKNDESAKDKGEHANDEDMFDVDGEDVSLNALKKAYKNSKKSMKKNESVRRTDGDEEDEGDHDEEDEAEDLEKEKVNKKKGEKRNSHFDDIRNASEMGVTRIKIKTTADGIATGKARYGSAA